MQAKISSLSRSTLLFPLALVLFEFSVYIANDMVQPAMLRVTQEFLTDISWVSTAMTAFLAGGALLPWLTGPLSDRIGRRPVLLSGVAFFVLACLATYLATDIESFIALRVLQGMGLCFINAVGYAAVQEAFEEKTAVRVTALMANVALIAPLVGPLAGAALIEIAPWRAIFLVIAAFSFVSLLLLWRSMPETVQPSHERWRLGQMGRDYLAAFGNARFVLAALCIPLMALPLMGWIALSPVILMDDFGMSSFGYGMMQLPVFGGLIAGNLVLAWAADRWPLGRSVLIGMWPASLGVALMVAGGTFSDVPHYWLAAGMTLLSFGEGLSFGVLYRFALMSSSVAKGTVSASMSMLCMVGFALGIEGLKLAYLGGGVLGFALLAVVTQTLFVQLALRSVRAGMAERAAPAEGIAVPDEVKSATQSA